jgi:RNA polymerase sigma-70 factor (ECF subfamily)
MIVAWNSRAELNRAASEAEAGPPTRPAPAGAGDIALLHRIGAGDESAVGELIDRHAGRLYGVARTLTGNDADAEDVVQETFAGACESAGSFRGESSVKTWLTKILVRRAAKTRRSGRRWNLNFLSRSAPPAPAAAKTPTDGVDSRLDVTEMLARLSPEHREVIVLRELQGLSYEEIAAALGVPRGTVESRLHRARRELKDRFAGYFES